MNSVQLNKETLFYDFYLIDYNCPEDVASFIGDNVCDDALNVYECAYDWWDCCKEEADLTFCTNCTCEDVQTFPPPRPGVQRITELEECRIAANNLCEPKHNNELCDWDRGDCCGPNVNCFHPPCDPCHFTKFPLKTLYELGCKEIMFGRGDELFYTDAFQEAYPTIGNTSFS